MDAVQRDLFSGTLMGRLVQKRWADNVDRTLERMAQERKCLMCGREDCPRPVKRTASAS